MLAPARRLAIADLLAVAIFAFRPGVVVTPCTHVVVVVVVVVRVLLLLLLILLLLRWRPVLLALGASLLRLLRQQRLLLRAQHAGGLFLRACLWPAVLLLARQLLDRSGPARCFTGSNVRSVPGILPIMGLTAPSHGLCAT